MERVKKTWIQAKEIRKKIWDGYGYYITVACLLTLFGAAAYLYRTDRNNASIPVPPEEETVAALSPVEAEMPSEPEEAPERLRFAMPVLGEITGEYSPDALQWNQTLGQWRTHEGIDISAPTGTAVMASEKGVVLSAYEDDLYGLVIELGHDGGYVTRYCSLGTLELVSVGDEVARNQVISSVGSGALLESADPPHVHFELTLNGEPVEPQFEP